MAAFAGRWCHRGPLGQIGAEAGTMKDLTGRKPHCAEDIVRKLRFADELVAEGKSGKEFAEPDVWPATLYNWWRS